MLKNWIVNTKQVKKKESGFINRVNYLVDKNRSSHEYTNIKMLHDGSKNILAEIDARRDFRRENGLRGGGVSNYATSFVMSLPRDIKQPTPEQWQKIGLYAVKNIADTIGIDYQELKKISHIVLHDETTQPEKASHIHLLVGNVLNNDVIKGVSQFKATHAVKMSFNRSVKALLSVDNNNYIPKQQSVGKKPMWLAQAEKAQRIMSVYEDFKNGLKKWWKDIKANKNAVESSKKAAEKFDNLEKLAPEELTEEIYKNIENIEEDEPNFELPKFLKSGEIKKPENIDHNEKITPKTDRKRRRRKPKPDLKIGNN